MYDDQNWAVIVLPHETTNNRKLLPETLETGQSGFVRTDGSRRHDQASMR
jgi:hypothetical protein